MLYFITCIKPFGLLHSLMLKKMLFMYTDTYNISLGVNPFNTVQLKR